MMSERSSDRPALESEGEARTAVPGVRSFDHTADVGLLIEADSRTELFGRAARGALWMALGAPAEAGTEHRRTVELRDDDLPGLLRAWLREVLFLQEVEGFAASELRIEGPEPIPEGGWQLRATLLGGAPSSEPMREIKGVTWHGLEVVEEEGRWRARVIFDV